MTQLPHLIRDKIEDYLNFTIWRSKMNRICDEYNQKTYVVESRLLGCTYIVFSCRPFNFRRYKDNVWKPHRNIYGTNLKKKSSIERDYGISPNY